MSRSALCKLRYQQVSARIARACAGLAAGAFAATAFASGAAADARLWDGAFTIWRVTSQCQAADFNLGSFRALYRARLKPGDPPAAIIFQADTLNHTFVIRATTDTATLQGTSDYCGIDVDPRLAEPKIWTDGTYTISVTPSNVTDTTPTIHVTGQVTRFANITGCNISFRAAFLRRP